MTKPSLQSFNRIVAILKKMDGRSFQAYGELADQSFNHHDYRLRFRHIQGSPGAFPASVCFLVMRKEKLGLPDTCLTNAWRETATADYLLRAFGQGIARHARQNRGAQGSGSFQPMALPPQIVKRNVVRFCGADIRIALRISLPGSADNRVLGEAAIAMLAEELPAIVASLKVSVAQAWALQRHCDTVEDHAFLQSRLEAHGWVAFVGDGAVLPRQSGVSQLPLQEDAVAFKAPDDLAVKVNLPNAGQVRGIGIPTGVSVVIGSAFHGKSTLLNALAKGVYPHIPGDGRERVVTCSNALYICAEEGRSIKGVDISAFMPDLPGTADPQWLRTDNASSSTSQAAATIEAVLAGAKLLLLDEDTSATNFLIHDRHMRRLIPEDRNVPFYDRVQQLFDQYGVSTLMVVGGSSDYLGVSRHVIAMRNFRPVCMTEKARQFSLPKPLTPPTPLAITDGRRVRVQHFDPSYCAKRLGETIAVRIKPLRLQEKILEYGNQRLDLSNLTALVDPDQVLAVGYALLLAREQFADARLSPAQLAEAICRRIDDEGIDLLCPDESGMPFLATFRALELAGAINRLRNLTYEKPRRI